MTGESSPQNRTLLVISLDAYRFSTRSRKAASAYSTLGATVFLGLSGAGRTGRWDAPGEFERDGLSVRQLYVRRPWVKPNRRSQLRNLVISYVPALARMAISAVNTPADVVHVTGTPLALLGLLHKLRFRSCLVLDIQERPGAVAAPGSVTALFTHIEKWVLRYSSRYVDLATVVTHGDVETVIGLGFPHVELVRNAPRLSWRAQYLPIGRRKPFGVISFVVIGSVFEGRAYEILLQAVAAASSKRPIRLNIVGPGRPDYVASLKKLCDSLGIGRMVSWMGPIDSSEVSAAYLAADVGLVLYETDKSGNDGLSNKILECVATGRPVIAGDLPENRRFVLENSVGWLTPVSVEALASVLQYVGVDGDFSELCERCRALGDTWLNWESEFSKVLLTVQGKFGGPTVESV